MFMYLLISIQYLSIYVYVLTNKYTILISKYNFVVRNHLMLSVTLKKLDLDIL